MHRISPQAGGVMNCMDNQTLAYQLARWQPASREEEMTAVIERANEMRITWEEAIALIKVTNRRTGR